MDKKGSFHADSITYRLHDRDLISNVSLSFNPGILYGILGPNGSGKSTLLKALTGIWKPTSGNVYWQGKDLLKQDRRTISKTVSLVPQHTHVPFDFSVTEMVSMGLYPHGKKPSENILKPILITVDVWHLRDRLISQLSHGERQRVYIARALMTESPVLLLDEPTASLDIGHQQAIWELLKQLLKQGKVIIVTSHDLGAAERFCDRIAVMHQGSCIAQGIFTEIMHAQLMQLVFNISP